MSNYVVTNIRLLEEDYLRLKQEAANKRQSLSAVIREKVGKRGHSKVDIEKFMQDIRKLAKENAKYLKGVDGTAIIRNIRDDAKW